MLRIIKIVLLLTFAFNSAFGQDSIRNRIIVIARATSDSIILRWAPADYESWQRGLKSGYKVERYTFQHGRSTQKLMLTPNPLKPISLPRWEELSKTNEYAGIAAQAIYGKDFEIEAQGSLVVNIFNRASIQQNRYSFALFAADHSLSVAKGMGLSLTDKQAAKGEKYLYLVYFADQSKACDTAFVFSGTDEITPLQKPVFAEIESTDKSIALSWRSTGGRLAYSSFEIHRSDDGGKTFHLLNSSPLINTIQDDKQDAPNFYLDTVAFLNHKYVFKVRGNTPFGDKGPFSDTISASLKSILKENPHIIKHVTGIAGAELEWDFSPKAEALIEDFQVLRSTESNKNFVAVSGSLDRKIRKFTDVKPLNTAYYLIEATGKNGEKRLSFPVLVQLIDSIPPDPPTRLVAKADTTGRVILRWNKSVAADVYGYRIYRANSENEEFSQITVSPVRDTFYTDQIKLKTLTKKVFYQIMAVDQRQNHSELSQTFGIKRPDIVPPAAPVITDLQSSTKVISISWIPSNSSDVINHKILRKKINDSDWAELQTLSSTTTNYNDSSMVDAEVYQYSIVAVDESGLKSAPSQILSGKKLEEDISRIVLTGKADRVMTCVDLSWNSHDPNGKYTIYRAEEERPLFFYAVTNDQYFTDKKVKPGTKYKYLVKFTSESLIKISNEIIVSY